MRCDLGQIGDELFIEDCESEGGDNGDSAGKQEIRSKQKNKDFIWLLLVEKFINLLIYSIY